MAEDAASKMALQSLKQKYAGSSNSATLSGDSMDASKRASNDSSSEVSSGSSLSSQTLNQILEILGTRRNGVWSTQVDVEYKRKFGSGKELPKDWPKTVIQMMESVPEASMPIKADMPIPDRFIITPNSSYAASSTTSATTPATSSTPSSASAAAASTKAPQLQISPTAANSKASSSSATSSTANIAPSKSGSPSSSKIAGGGSSPGTPAGSGLPTIDLPKDDLWNVYITAINSTTNVFLRLLGDEYSQKFDNLATDMELFYFHDTKMEAVSQPQV